jgi:hypothetical protein
MNLSAARKRVDLLERNLRTQCDLIVELLAHPDTTVEQIEQARQYARNAIETKRELEAIIIERGIYR